MQNLEIENMLLEIFDRFSIDYIKYHIDNNVYCIDKIFDHDMKNIELKFKIQDGKVLKLGTFYVRACYYDIKVFDAYLLGLINGIETGIHKERKGL